MGRARGKAYGVVPIFIPHLGCPHICTFCDQRSISGEVNPVTPETVREELKEAFARVDTSGGNRPEIAFYGGSFTCLAREQMEAFLREARPYLESKKASGLRCSTRPDGITPDILDLLAGYGMTTVELGAQSLSNEVLRINRRGSTAADVRQAVALLRERGFTVGLQIMTGLPGDNARRLKETVDEVIRLHPDMLRIYPTVVIRGTELAHWMEAGQFKPMGLEEAVGVCAGILARMEQNGIPVIRMGLHASPSIEREQVGGAYHPAFRELCEARLFRERAEETIRRFPKGTRLLLTVSPRDVSRAVGQKRSNLLHWAEAGYPVRLRTSEALLPGAFSVSEEGARPVQK